jgi:hypothetical protein
MRVRELIVELQKKDPELAVAYPSRFNGRDDYPKVVHQVVTTTECSTPGEMVRCVILDPTFAQLDRSEEVRAQSLAAFKKEREKRKEAFVESMTKRVAKRATKLVAKRGARG